MKWVFFQDFEYLYHLESLNAVLYLSGHNWTEFLVDFKMGESLGLGKKSSGPETDTETWSWFRSYTSRYILSSLLSFFLNLRSIQFKVDWVCYVSQDCLFHALAFLACINDTKSKYLLFLSTLIQKNFSRIVTFIT